jgi:hypothetical protein
MVRRYVTKIPADCLCDNFNILKATDLAMIRNLKVTFEKFDVIRNYGHKQVTCVLLFLLLTFPANFLAICRTSW